MSAARSLSLLSAALEARAQSFLVTDLLTAADLLVVDAVAPRYHESDADVLLGFALAVRAPRAGHVGVDLRTIRERADDERILFSADGGDEPAAVDWPKNVARWEQRVLASPLVGEPAQRDRPFVRQLLHDGHTLLMTRRMWRAQERLAEGLRALVASPPCPAFDQAAVEQTIAQLFDQPHSPAAHAVRTSVRSRLAVTIGGPGSGKTYSVQRVVALLLELTAQALSPLRIELAAPTGKAAVRMQQALAEGLDALPASETTRAALRALRPRTLHKMLGVRPNGTVRHDRDRPLFADLVIVDEASMVDLVMMQRLLDAVPAGARLVLLGDRDQLASVEVGSVLADLVSGAPAAGDAPADDDALARSIVRFSGSYRFGKAKGVAEIARCLQRRDPGDLERALALLTGQERLDGDIRRLAVAGAADDEPGGRAHPTDAQLDALAAPYLASEGYVGILAAAIAAHGERSPALHDPALHRQLLDALERYRVLCVHRRGPRGVAGIEHALAARVRAALEGAIREQRKLPARAPVRLPSGHGQFLGEAILITENTYDVGLMNGDIGLVLPSPRGLVAVFPRYEEGAISCREVALARLPAHTGAFAMTVHKSQGSQFDRVALVLAGRRSPIQTRELVYTAITRAKSKLDWLGSANELRDALARPIERASGLHELLWRKTGA